MDLGLFCLALASGLAYSGRKLLDRWIGKLREKKRLALAVGLPLPHFPLYQVVVAITIGFVILELLGLGFALCVVSSNTK